jgi:inorganic triphosphatase YgiF
MPIETELKLRLSPDGVARLQRNTLLKSLSISKPITQRLYSIYYDTPKLDLNRHGIGLRLRRSGRRWVQTIKGGGGVTAGLHQRDEWEFPVLKEQLDFTKITDPALIKLFSSAELRDQLRPIFTTDFKRSARMLCLPDGGEVEFCLDRGEIIYGDNRIPLCEVELELKSGRPGQLFQLALELLNSVPFRLENVSKAERGYMLCLNGDSLPIKSGQVKLDPEMSVSNAFKAISWSCLNHLHANESGMLAGQDNEYLHQMRVALRRQRSAMSLFSKVLPKDGLSSLSRELKWLGNQLGPARDWDVFVMETLAPICASFSEHTGMKVLQDRCNQLRRQHHESACHAIESNHYVQLMLQMGEWLIEEDWFDQTGTSPIKMAGTQPGTTAKKFADNLLADRHRKMMKKGEGLTSFSVAELHDLRIIAKKQRYAAEFFAGFYPSRETRRYIRTLSSLQDILGAMNDTANAKRLLSELPVEGDTDSLQEAVGVVLGWSEGHASLKRLELERAWVKLTKIKPFW